MLYLWDSYNVSWIVGYLKTWKLISNVFYWLTWHTVFLELAAPSVHFLKRVRGGGGGRLKRTGVSILQRWPSTETNGKNSKGGVNGNFYDFELSKEGIIENRIFMVVHGRLFGVGVQNFAVQKGALKTGGRLIRGIRCLAVQSNLSYLDSHMTRFLLYCVILYHSKVRMISVAPLEKSSNMSQNMTDSTVKVENWIYSGRSALTEFLLMKKKNEIWVFIVLDRHSFQV